MDTGNVFALKKCHKLHKTNILTGTSTDDRKLGQTRINVRVKRYDIIVLLNDLFKTVIMKWRTKWHGCSNPSVTRGTSSTCLLSFAGQGQGFLLQYERHIRVTSQNTETKNAPSLQQRMRRPRIQRVTVFCEARSNYNPTTVWRLTL